MKKTKYQWIALVSFYLGALANIAGWITKSWIFIVAPFILWGVALYCVVFKPVKHAAPAPSPQQPKPLEEE